MNLKVYWPFSRSVLHTYLSYGVNSVVFTLGGFLRVILAFFLWEAIFKSSGGTTLAGFSWVEMATYVVVMDFTIRLTLSAEADGWVGEEIRSGAIAMNLIKPISYTLRMFFLSLGSLIYTFLLEFLPLALVMGAIGTLALGFPPPDLARTALFLVSVGIGFLIMFSINLAFGFMAFWFTNMWGLGNLKYNILVFLSGGVIPLAFFPQAVQPVVNALPFQYIHTTPVMIFLGKIPVDAALPTLGMQALWAIVFFGISQLIFRAAVSKLTVQGG